MLDRSRALVARAENNGETPPSGIENVLREQKATAGRRQHDRGELETFGYRAMQREPAEG
jgi:hypothetical protein